MGRSHLLGSDFFVRRSRRGYSRARTGNGRTMTAWTTTTSDNSPLATSFSSSALPDRGSRAGGQSALSFEVVETHRRALVNADGQKSDEEKVAAKRWAGKGRDDGG